ncbi:MAG TPA: hypothetical protein VLQ79_13400, partial [Myxococcaceae bacterium]|nr:hypothetical protein [Myxococcaceae bacterium]
LTLQAVRRMEAPDLGRAIGLVASGELSLAGLVTDRFAMDEVSLAFERAVTRGGLKVVVEPGR